MRRIVIYGISLLIGISLGITTLPAVWNLIGQSNSMFNQDWLNGLIGALIFLLLTTLFISPLSKGLEKIDSTISNVNLSKVVYSLLGAVLGLIVGLLLSIPFLVLNIPVLSSIAPFILMILLAYLGYSLFRRRGRDVFSIFRRQNLSGTSNDNKNSFSKLLDTSVIIDGRVFDIIKTGFIDGKIIIPNFVLLELQSLADSSDGLKRSKGRLGLDMVNEFKKQKEIVISKKDYNDIHEVDTKLLRFASEIGAKLITNDFNLNKVAEIQGGEVLNINDLANALKQQVVVGEVLAVEIIRSGTERHQGVGFMPDGTMIVVEDSDQMVGKIVKAQVTKVLQTSAGRMIFAEMTQEK